MKIPLFVKQMITSLLGISLLCSAYAFGQADGDNRDSTSHERWYQVEMIVFSRPAGTSQEHWPTDLKLSYPENVQTLKTDASAGESLVMLPAGERQLNAQAATLAKSGTYTLLFHQAWRQMIEGHKTHILITGGQSYNGHQELEGSISLSVAQYLKLQTNLWYTQFVPLGTPVTETWPELPALPNGQPGDAEVPQNFLIKRMVKISQQRSLRSHEVHYIDHPLLGIIVKITPYDAPVTKPQP